MKLTRAAQQQIDNAMYVGLFGMTISVVNKQLRLPPNATENMRRDHMGVVALKCLRDIEDQVTKAVNTAPQEIKDAFTLDVAMTFVHDMAKVVGDDLRERGLSGTALLFADFT